MGGIEITICDVKVGSWRSTLRPVCVQMRRLLDADKSLARKFDRLERQHPVSNSATHEATEREEAWDWVYCGSEGLIEGSAAKDPRSRLFVAASANNSSPTVV